MAGPHRDRLFLHAACTGVAQVWLAGPWCRLVSAFLWLTTRLAVVAMEGVAAATASASIIVRQRGGVDGPGQPREHRACHRKGNFVRQLPECSESRYRWRGGYSSRVRPHLAIAAFSRLWPFAGPAGSLHDDRRRQLALIGAKFVCRTKTGTLRGLALRQIDFVSCWQGAE